MASIAAETLPVPPRRPLVDRLPQVSAQASSRSVLPLIERSRAAQFLAILAFALLVRGPVFGEWNYDIDDQFYSLVGQRMLAGDLLYVDVFDRKGPLLYLIYAGVAAIWSQPIAFQIAATLCAAAGAYAINRITRMVAGAQHGLLAAAAYLALMCFFGGATGQSPVFYNTPMIVAAWAIVDRLPLLRAGRIDAVVVAGIGCASAAIAIKQSAAFESLFFGGFITFHLLRSGASVRRVLAQLALLAGIAVLPWALTYAWYARAGHVPELYQALIGSNLHRQYDSWIGRATRMTILVGQIILPLAFGVLGARRLERETQRRDVLAFVVLWAAAAFLSIAGFPIVYSHYVLPLLPALCILASGYFARGTAGALAFAGTISVALISGHTLDLPQRWKAHRDGAAVVAYVRAVTPHGKLLVWGIPSYLYSQLGVKPPSILAFPAHFYQGDESGVSGLDERAELRRILATRPETVVVQDPILARPLNAPNMAAVARYVRTCPQIRRMMLWDHNGEQPQVIYSRCRGFQRPSA